MILKLTLSKRKFFCSTYKSTIYFSDSCLFSTSKVALLSNDGQRQFDLRSEKQSYRLSVPWQQLQQMETLLQLSKKLLGNKQLLQAFEIFWNDSFTRAGFCKLNNSNNHSLKIADITKCKTWKKSYSSSVL